MQAKSTKNSVNTQKQAKNNKHMKKYDLLVYSWGYSNPQQWHQLKLVNTSKILPMQRYFLKKFTSVQHMK